MFWVLRRSIFSDKAAAFFNVLNNNNNNNGNSTLTAGNSKTNIPKNVAYNKLSSHDDYLLDEQNGNVVHQQSQKNTSLKDKFDEIIDLNATSDFEEELTDDSDYDESLTCNVCDRSFYNRKLLEQHQQKKRHFGCSACDTIFPSIMQLEHHKEEFDHWSDSETSALTCHNPNHCHHYDDDEDFDSDDSFIESGEEMERLL